MKKIFKKIIFYILRFQSILILKKYKPKIITITGSVGKTSSKDAIYQVLSSFVYVRKSDKSYNSQIGLPLTILGCPNGWDNPFVWILNFLKGLSLILFKHKYPKWLVLEVGVGKPGDMQETAMWLSSDIVVITAIGETPPHIEFFKSKNHLIEEKSKLVNTLKKEGILILNADDKNVLEMKNKTKAKILSYGFNNEANLVSSNENIFYSHPDKNVITKNENELKEIFEKIKPEGIAFKLETEGNTFPVVLEGVFGKNNIYSSLCALAVAVSLKLDILASISSLKKFNSPPGRMKILNGIKDTTIIDDTYNSSPLALELALNTMKDIKTNNRKIAILGDMLELGKYTQKSHEDMGSIAKDCIDILITLGQRSEFIKEGAMNVGMQEGEVFHFEERQDLIDFILNFVKEKDVILVKGSQGMRMEKIVFELLEDKTNSQKLLARQDTNWLNKK